MWMWICDIVVYTEKSENFFYKCKLFSDYFNSPVDFSNFVNYTIIETFPSLDGLSLAQIAFEKYPWLEKLWFFDLHWQDQILYSFNFLLGQIIFFGIIFLVFYGIFWIYKVFKEIRNSGEK